MTDGAKARRWIGAMAVPACLFAHDQMKLITFLDDTKRGPDAPRGQCLDSAAPKYSPQTPIGRRCP